MQKIILILLATTLSTAAFATPKHVVIIRDAEKPEDGNILSDEGEVRAKALVQYVKESPDMKPLGLPHFIFAAKPKKETSSVRSIQTVIPLAKALNLDINADYIRDDYRELVALILNDPKYNNKTIFIAWAHSKIGKMARAFGASDAPKDWDDEEYDRTWIIHFKNNQFESFEDVKQNIQ